MEEIKVIAPARKFEGAAETKAVEKIGKKILEVKAERLKNMDFVSRKEYTETKQYFEELGIDTSKEDLTFDNNGALYTIAVADFIERKVRPQLVAEGLIKSSRVNVKGTSAVKIPVSALKTAQALPDSGDITYAGGNYSPVTVTLGWIYSAEKITYELITQSNVDIIQDQLFEIGDAISRKIDSDILAAFETATPANDANSNYRALGVGNYLTYVDLVSDMADMMANQGMPSAVVMDPVTWGKFMSDSNVISAMGFNSVQPGVVFPQVISLFGMKFMVSTQVSANTAFLVDVDRCGYFLEGSGVEVMDGRVSGSTAQEIIGIKLYGVTVAQPQAVYRIVGNI